MGLGRLLEEAAEAGFVAELPPTLSPALQRLLGSLGIPVRFVVDARLPPALQPRRRRAGRIGDRLLELLADGKPRSGHELHAALAGYRYDSVVRELGLLVRDGRLRRVRRGVYSLAE